MRRGEGLLELLLTPVAAARPLAHAWRRGCPQAAPRGGRASRRSRRQRRRGGGQHHRRFAFSDWGENKPTKIYLSDLLFKHYFHLFTISLFPPFHYFHLSPFPPFHYFHLNTILPQILGSLPEVIRSCCHHHHHHHHQRSSRGRLEWSARFHRPSRRVAGPGKRHSARGTPRAQPRDVRSAGRDTWNLTGEALGGPRKRSWRRCSRARSGRLSAIRGAHSGAFDRPF